MLVAALLMVRMDTIRLIKLVQVTKYPGTIRSGTTCAAIQQRVTKCNSGEIAMGACLRSHSCSKMQQKMKLYRSFQLVLIFVFFSAASGFAQDVDLDSLSINQQYKLLRDLNCEASPRGAYCTLADQRRLESIDVEKLAIVPIDDVWINKLVNSKILIINEDHLFPQNRVFNHYLLNRLLADNHHYVFFETLNHDVSDTTTTIDHSTGYYANEPQMAENIRLVLRQCHKAYQYEELSDKLNEGKYYRLGLDKKVNPKFYEDFKRQTLDSTNYITMMNKRDFGQFMNFYEKYNHINQSDPAAKFIIMVGFGHINEQKGSCVGSNCWYPLTYLLKTYLHQDPMTIEITEQIDKCDERKSKLYNKLTARLANDKFYRIGDLSAISEDKRIYIAGAMKTKCTIISPKINYEKGRESWLRFDGKKEFGIDKKYYQHINGNVVVKAFYIAENERTTTPADIVYIDKMKGNYLLLYKGRYKITINGKLVNNYIISVP